MAVELGKDLLPIPPRDSPLEAFSGIADMAVLLGRRMDLATFVSVDHEGLSLQTRIIRRIGKPKAQYFTPDEIITGLDAFIIKQIECGNLSRAILEERTLNRIPTVEISKEGRKIRRWESLTTDQRLVLGLEVRIDDKGESRTWYVRGIEDHKILPIRKIFKALFLKSPKS